MERIQLQGRAPTIRDQQRAFRAARVATQSADADQLRADLNARQFVGPATPVRLRREFSDEAESARYWRLVDDLKRWGWCELNESGTPWLGDAFGK
jgi:hypothetical protein